MVFDQTQLNAWLATSNTTFVTFMDQLSTTIRSHPSRSILAVVRPYLPTVIQFAKETRSPALTSLLESIVASHLPFGLNRVMQMSMDDEQRMLSNLSRQALGRWCGRTDALPADLVDLLGHASNNDVFQPDIWAALIYRSNASMWKILPGLIDLCSSNSTSHFLPMLYAALDGQDVGTNTHSTEFSCMIPRLITSIPSKSCAPADSANAAWCVLALYQSRAELRESIASQITELVNILPFEHLFRVPVQLFFRRLCSVTHDDSYMGSLVAQLVGRGLQLIVKQFSDQAEDSAKSLSGLEVFCEFLLQVCIQQLH
jgi:hypothetical protein